MGIFKKLSGTTENEFSFGKGDNRVYLRNNSGEIEAKTKTLAYFPVLPSRGSNFAYELYVDGTNGSDTAGVGRGQSGLPYQTISAAVTAASSGTLIVVKAGTYTPTTSISKAGVNFRFEKGAVINYTAGNAPLFNCATSTTPSYIYGQGQFNISCNYAFYYSSYNGITDLYIEFAKIVHTGSSTTVIDIAAGGIVKGDISSSATTYIDRYHGESARTVMIDGNRTFTNTNASSYIGYGDMSILVIGGMKHTTKSNGWYFHYCPYVLVNTFMLLQSDSDYTKEGLTIVASDVLVYGNVFSSHIITSSYMQIYGTVTSLTVTASSHVLAPGGVCYLDFSAAGTFKGKHHNSAGLNNYIIVNHADAVVDIDEVGGTNTYWTNVYNTVGTLYLRNPRGGRLLLWGGDAALTYVTGVSKLTNDVYMQRGKCIWEADWDDAYFSLRSLGGASNPTILEIRNCTLKTTTGIIDYEVTGDTYSQLKIKNATLELISTDMTAVRYIINKINASSLILDNATFVTAHADQNAIIFNHASTNANATVKVYSGGVSTNDLKMTTGRKGKYEFIDAGTPYKITLNDNAGSGNVTFDNGGSGYATIDDLVTAINGDAITLTASKVGGNLIIEHDSVGYATTWSNVVGFTTTYPWRIFPSWPANNVITGTAIIEDADITNT